MEDMFHIQLKDKLFGEDMLCNRDSGCQVWKDRCSWSHKRTHLSKCTSKKQTCFECYRRTKRCLMKLLMFIHIKKVHIDIDPNAKSVHSMPYPVPQIHLKTFKKELDHLVWLGVLAPQQESEWVSSSFIIQKKDNRVCWISDSRQLRKVIWHKQYPLPIITDILRKRSGYKAFAKLDISMQCYTFELDKKKSRPLYHHHTIW